MTTYDQYLSTVKSQLEPNILAHSLALQACMSGVYDYLSSIGSLKADERPKEEWELAGLIHDIDYSGEFKEAHPMKTLEALAKYGLTITPEVHHIVLAHGPSISGVLPTSQADWTIFCADSLTGLITAVALILPSKKLTDVKLSSVVKRFLKEPKFAAGTRRDEVAMCSHPDGLNIPLEKFIEICLESMKKVAGEIGL